MVAQKFKIAQKLVEMVKKAIFYYETKYDGVQFYQSLMRELWLDV